MIFLAFSEYFISATYNYNKRSYLGYKKSFHQIYVNECLKLSLQSEKKKIYKDDAFSISFIRQFIDITFKVETYLDILDKILVTLRVNIKILYYN